MLEFDIALQAARTLRVWILAAAALFVAIAAGAEGGAVSPLQQLSQSPNSTAIGASVVPGAIRAADAQSYPAYAGFADRKSLSLSHMALFSDGSYDSVAFSYPTMQRGAWSVGLYRMTSGSADQRDAAGNITGSFNDQQNLLRFGYGDRILPTLAWGVGVDYLNHTLAGAATRAIAAGGGVQYRSGRVSAGVTGDNLIETVSGESSDGLPAQFRLNAAYAFFDRLTLGLDALVAPTTNLRVGLEYALFDSFSLRLGRGNDGIGAGLGGKYKDWQFDYNMVVHDLGLAQHLAVSKFFGASRQALHEARAEELYREARAQAIDGRYAVAAKDMEEASRYTELPLERRAFRDGLRALQKAGVTELGADEPQATLRKGAGFYLEQKPGLARVMFLTVSAKDPYNDMVKRLIALVSRPEDIPAPPSFVDVDPVRLKLYKIDEYFAKHQLDLALKECREILALDPTSIIGYVRLGSIYYALGIKAEALKAWKYAAVLDPANADVIKALRFIHEEHLDAEAAEPAPAASQKEGGSK